MFCARSNCGSFVTDSYASKQCTKCLTAIYCSKDCHKTDFQAHKEKCTDAITKSPTLTIDHLLRETVCHSALRAALESAIRWYYSDCVIELDEVGGYRLLSIKTDVPPAGLITIHSKGRSGNFKPQTLLDQLNQPVEPIRPVAHQHERGLLVAAPEWYRK